MVSVDSLEVELKEPQPNIHHAIIPEIEALPHDTLLNEIIGRVAEAPCGLPVVDAKNKYLGVVSRGGVAGNP